MFSLIFWVCSDKIKLPPSFSLHYLDRKKPLGLRNERSYLYFDSSRLLSDRCFFPNTWRRLTSFFFSFHYYFCACCCCCDVRTSTRFSTPSFNCCIVQHTNAQEKESWVGARKIEERRNAKSFFFRSSSSNPLNHFFLTLGISSSILSEDPSTGLKVSNSGGKRERESGQECKSTYSDGRARAYSNFFVS